MTSFPIPTDIPSRSHRGRTAVVVAIIDDNNCLVQFLQALGGPEPARNLDSVEEGQRVYLTYEPEIHKWFIL